MFLEVVGSLVVIAAIGYGYKKYTESKAKKAAVASTVASFGTAQKADPKPAAPAPVPSPPTVILPGDVLGPDGIDHKHTVTGDGKDPSDGFTPNK